MLIRANKCLLLLVLLAILFDHVVAKILFSHCVTVCLFWRRHSLVSISRFVIQCETNYVCFTLFLV